MVQIVYISFCSVMRATVHIDAHVQQNGDNPVSLLGTDSTRKQSATRPVVEARILLSWIYGGISIYWLFIPAPLARLRSSKRSCSPLKGQCTDHHFSGPGTALGRVCV